MAERPPSLQEKIAQLRSAFLADLPARTAQIRLLWESPARAEPAALTELHRQLHTIKGTAASFGLKDLSIVAAEAENELKTLAGLPAEAFARSYDRLARLLDTLEAVGRAAGDEAGSRRHPTGFEPARAGPAAEEAPASRLIYLCDDDPLQLAALEVQLHCFGYEVARFTDPARLCAAVAERRPDAVVMDIVFPEGESAGTDTIGTLQHGAETPLPTVFLSARRDFEARLRSVRAGGSAYFAKPVRPLELVEVLDALTSRREPEPFRILVVDDEPAVAGYHALILEEAGMVTRTLQAPEAVLETLTEFRPDLVLMDMYMPQCTGRELAQVIRQIPEFIGLPIVYLSSETDAHKQFSALRVGADGFLVKPIQPEPLVAAVAVRAERMRAVRSLMARDSLTGLFNHTTIKQLLDTAVAHARRRGSELCFAMIDVDHFKSINDGHGHPAGDQVLLALSRLLQQRLRRSDLVGRYGGEEFAVVLEGTTLPRAHRLLDELREDFARVRFYAGDGEFSCTFSGGVAAFPHYDHPDALCEAADRALYQAKREGRNRVVRG